MVSCFFYTKNSNYYEPSRCTKTTTANIVDTLCLHATPPRCSVPKEYTKTSVFLVHESCTACNFPAPRIQRLVAQRLQ